MTKQKLWTDEDQAALVDMAARRVPTVEIAKALGRTIDAIGQRAKVTGVRLRRRGPNLIPFPDGFAEFAAERTAKELAAHYGRTVDMVTRWVSRMPEDWQARRAAIVARIRIELSQETRRKTLAATAGERAAARAARALSEEQKQRQRERSVRSWQRKKERMRIEREKKNAPPEGFAAAAITMSSPKLEKLYGRGSGTIAKWLATLSPQDAAARAAEMKKNSIEAARSGQAKAQRAPKKAKPARVAAEPGAKTKPPGRPVNWGFRLPPPVAGPPLTLASQAAEFLKRPPHRFCNVYDAEKVHGKVFRGMYFCGAMGCIPTSKMIEIARERGFSL